MRPRGAVVLLLLAVLALAGCGEGNPDHPENRAANGRVGSLLVRNLHVEEPRMQEHPAGSDVPVYLSLVNEGSVDDALLGGSTPAAASVGLRRADPGAGPARSVPRVPLPASRTAELVPSSYFLMLDDLRRPLAAGQAVPITLTFQRAGGLTLDVPVQLPGADPLSPGERFGPSTPATR
ncbi:MAG TPA: copper chaperone PCu(A)C [Frankiaceae bacterium]|nr:copper chaperone PCu(A)C [Frankiaceae bacterium]